MALGGGEGGGAIIGEALGVLASQGGPRSYTKPRIVKLTTVARAEARGQLYSGALPRLRAVRSLTTTTLPC